MRASDARAIPISRFLEYHGLKPDRIRSHGRELWYSSPIRSGDKTPSFKVDTQLNVWFDHGLGQGGTLIDLVCELKSVTVSEALAILDATGLGPAMQKYTDAPRLFGKTNSAKTSVAGEKEKLTKSVAQLPGHKAETQAAFQILKVCEIQHPALLDYINTRAINLRLARHYLHQVHFRPASGVGQFFGLGFPCGEPPHQGYDVRSAIFKGYVGTGKDISFVYGTVGQGTRGEEGRRADRECKNEPHSIAVFEGFMDFLSLLTHRRTNALEEDAIILHSTSLKRRAIARIQAGNYQSVELYLDNDLAGLKATSFYQTELGRNLTTDASSLYQNHKDLNEWLIAKG